MKPGGLYSVALFFIAPGEFVFFFVEIVVWRRRVLVVFIFFVFVA